MSSTKIEVIDSDPIAPVTIEHNVEEFLSDGQLEQHYNYIDYEFERGGAYCKARTYLDEIKTVSVHGPFADRDELKEIDAPDFYAEVLAYLKRRFLMIDILGDNGQETIWRHPDLDEEFD